LITKHFGSQTVSPGNVVTLTLTVSNPSRPNAVTLTGVNFVDNFPLGLIVATPNGLTNDTCSALVPPGQQGIVATAGDNKVSLGLLGGPGIPAVPPDQGPTLAVNASCSFTVNVTTTNAAATDLVNTTSAVSANESGPGGTATDVLNVSAGGILDYFPNLNVSDSSINITNTGLSNGGNLCANVYTFSPDEQLIACCSCVVTPNALVSLSVVNDLISNTLTPAVPTSVVVKIIPTLPAGGNCNGSAGNLVAATLAPGLTAWGTKLHLTTAPSTVTGRTEEEFQQFLLSAAERTHLGSLCSFIQSNGSGFGICRSCRLGGQGAVTNK